MGRFWWRAARAGLRGDTLTPRDRVCQRGRAGPFDASGLDWFGGMSPGNIEEFTLAARGEQAYRPLVQRLAEEAVAAVAAGGIQVAADYQLSDSDLRALQARRGEGDYLDRMRITYTGGVDGWIDDCMAMTRPWGFELEAISVPVSVWYGPWTTC